MSKENPTTGDMVKRLSLMAVVGSIGVGVALNIDRWWAWVLTAAAAAAFVVYVRRTAAKWLELLDDAAERAHPAPLDDQLPTLVEHGFRHPLRWKVIQSDHVSVVSVDGTVVATISDGWQGPLLTTRWESALLRTSSGEVGAPICSGEYLQIPRDQDFQNLLATTKKLSAY